VSAPEEIPDSLWSNTLVRTAKGEPKAGIANVLVILRMHPLLRGALAFNGRSQNVIIRRPLPWDYNATGRAWVDEDDTECSAWMSRAAGRVSTRGFRCTPARPRPRTTARWGRSG